MSNAPNNTEKERCQEQELVEQQIPEEIIVDKILLIQNKEQECQAKLSELDQWKVRKVYDGVDDRGQECISLRWVMKSKVIGNKPGVKAQLCARGFEEEQDYRTDSPTCLREGLRCALSLIASKKWPINSIDVKTAFLQGKNLERNAFVRPPKEAHTNKFWKLNKCVYGLTDASRCWFLKVRDKRCKLGARPSQLDQGLFTSRKEQRLFTSCRNKELSCIHQCRSKHKTG